jgi:hypothetical protein
MPISVNSTAGRLAWSREGTRPFVSAIGRALLARPFATHAAHRILLVYIDHTLAYTQFNALLRHESRFAARGIHFRAVPYRDLDVARLPEKLDAIFLQSPYTPPKGELAGLLASLKAARPGVSISYFDWFAPVDIRFAEQVEPYVDFYVKKSLLRDRSQYLLPNVGHTNLTDYYAARFGTDNPPADWRVPPAIVDRLVVGPSFSTGQSLIGLFESADAPPDDARPIDLHARIALKGSDWYSAMRKEAAQAVAEHFGDLSVASKGSVSKQQYMREMEQSKLCFSPFGYGEICWRDFEAIAAGAVLVKPDMGHIDSAPDIYVPFETYIPVRWDLADLDARVREALAAPEERKRIARRAFTVVRRHLLGDELAILTERLAGIAPGGS